MDFLAEQQFAGDEAGLDGPATWDELFADAKAIKDKVPGVVPVEFPASSEESTVDRWYSYLYMTGSNVLSRSNASFMFGDVQEGLLPLRQSHVP